MKYKPFWLDEQGNLEIIDQTRLPHRYEILKLKNSDDVVRAITDMYVRGAGTIGCVAAFGIYLAARECNGDRSCLEKKAKEIRTSRPTAVNLMWAVDRMMGTINGTVDQEMLKTEAIRISDEDVERTRRIGELGYELMEEIRRKKGTDRINVLTHCNAGWLGIVDSGTALAPVYEAKRRGMDVHVWVDETRPRNQGASLTSWELARDQVDHTVIVDNAGGHLMMKGMVDIVFVGADRVARNGDVANKIGTYLKALAARDNDVPFYVNIPASTLDFETEDGVKDIPIETRDQDEVRYIRGLDREGEVTEILLTPPEAKALNIAFDVTPARLVTGLITERGVCHPDRASIDAMFPDIASRY